MKRPSFIGPPHDPGIWDIIPDMLAEYVPVIVRPSSDIVGLAVHAHRARGHHPAEGDGAPVDRASGAAPIMLRPRSLKFIVPVMLSPFCVTVQVMVSWPLCVRRCASPRAAHAALGSR